MKDPNRAIAPYIREISGRFRAEADKREASARCHDILREISGNPAFLTAVLHKHLETSGSLNNRNYPSVGLDIALNPHYALVANCWIPLPGRETNLSTKSIHHHGEMLLTTVTSFGPGYEHWTFTRPREIDPSRERYSMRLIERAPHPVSHVAFVDSYIPHVPMYPPSLSITYALWTSQKPVTWIDRVKRIPLLKRNEQLFKGVLKAAGLTRTLDLKIPVYYDFHPAEDGFKGIRDRIEFGRGPNADYLHSLFHILQETNNDGLASVIRRRLDQESRPDNRPLIERLLGDLGGGRAIEGRLSAGHTGVAHANFTSDAIEAALAALGDGSEASSPQADAAPGAVTL